MRSVLPTTMKVGVDGKERAFVIGERAARKVSVVGFIACVLAVLGIGAILAALRSTMQAMSTQRHRQHQAHAQTARFGLSMQRLLERQREYATSMDAFLREHQVRVETMSASIATAHDLAAARLLASDFASLDRQALLIAHERLTSARAELEEGLRELSKTVLSALGGADSHVGDPKEQTSTPTEEFDEDDDDAELEPAIEKLHARVQAGDFTWHMQPDVEAAWDRVQRELVSGRMTLRAADLEQLIADAGHPPFARRVGMAADAADVFAYFRHLYHAGKLHARKQELLDELDEWRTDEASVWGVLEVVQRLRNDGAFDLNWLSLDAISADASHPLRAHVHRRVTTGGDGANGGPPS